MSAALRLLLENNVPLVKQLLARKDVDPTF